MEQKKKRTGLYIALIVGGVILVAVIVTVILLMLDGNNKGKQEIKSSETVSEMQNKQDDTEKVDDTKTDDTKTDDVVESENESESEETIDEGMQPVAVSNDSIKLVNASSVLQPQGTNENPYLYYALNAVDGKSDTAWVEGVDGNGENEWIEFTFDRE